MRGRLRPCIEVLCERARPEHREVKGTLGPLAPVMRSLDTTASGRALRRLDGPYGVDLCWRARRNW